MYTITGNSRVQFHDFLYFLFLGSITEKNKHEKTDGGLTLLHIVGIYGGKSWPQIMTYDIRKKNAASRRLASG